MRGERGRKIDGDKDLEDEKDDDDDAARLSDSTGLCLVNYRLGGCAGNDAPPIGKDDDVADP